MIVSSNNFFFLIWNYFLYPLLILLICLEIFLQVIFLFDIKSLKKTILFFNPYCDQSYWDYEGISSFDEVNYSKHPILTLVKKKNKKFFKDYSPQPEIISNKNLVFYGSSFIGHEYFIDNYKEKINFAIKSYGFDQIYKSYNLTKDNFPNRTIIIGFLLEDIDRSIFTLRNFPKLKYEKINDNYVIRNLPISFEKNKNISISFLTYNLVKNLIFLSFNDYNYKNSYCKVEFKKEIFKYFVNNIVSNAKELNQNIIFVTFNFKDDINNLNWRHSFTKDYFLLNKIHHIDTTEVIKIDQNVKKNDISKYYNNIDNHLSVYGFKIIKDAIDIFIKQYK
jgi:hypothetical protein